MNISSVSFKIVVLEVMGNIVRTWQTVCVPVVKTVAELCGVNLSFVVEAYGFLKKERYQDETADKADDEGGGKKVEITVYEILYAGSEFPHQPRFDEKAGRARKGRRKDEYQQVYIERAGGDGEYLVRQRSKACYPHCPGVVFLVELFDCFVAVHCPVKLQYAETERIHKKHPNRVAQNAAKNGEKAGVKGKPKRLLRPPDGKRMGKNEDSANERADSAGTPYLVSAQ